MTYTSTELITDAYYAAGIVSREFETVSGSQISDGLKFLNNIITEKRIDLGMIPYETKYTFNALVGVQVYFIPNLIQIDTLVFYLGDVRYSMAYTPRNQFFGSGRVENIQTLPVQWYFERKTNGGNLHIYFAPDQNYPMEVHGTFQLPKVELNQDLTLTTTIADLGIPSLYSLEVLNPGQLVVNNFDLAGTYPTIGALINYINSGIIPGVQASLNVNNFVLSSNTNPPVPIYVQTAGYPPNGTRSKGNVRATTVSNLNATYNNGFNDDGAGATLTSNVVGALSIDGVGGFTVGDRVLVKDQTDSVENGVYTVSVVGDGVTPFVLTRSSNYDEPIEIEEGDLFFTTFGTVNGGLTFVQNSDVSVIGYSQIVFSQFNAISFSIFSTIEQPNYSVFNAVGFDEFYTTYLKYALADRLCAEFNYDTPPNVMRQLNKYEAWIEKESRTLDLRLGKTSTLQQQQNAVSWQWINLGKGFFPPY